MADQTLQIDPNWMQRVLEADKRLQVAKQAPGPFNLLPTHVGDVTRGEPSSAWDVLKQSVMSAFPAAGAAFGGPVGAALGLAMMGDTLYRESHPTTPMIDPRTGQPVQVLMGEVPAGAKSLLRSSEESPTYYSALKEAFSNPKMPNKLTPEQALAIVEKTPGVKAEEGKWVFGEPRKFFQAKPRWTKQEILDHINSNAVDVVEVPSRVDPTTTTQKVVTPPFVQSEFENWRDSNFTPDEAYEVRLPSGTINTVTGSREYANDYATRFNGQVLRHVPDEENYWRDANGFIFHPDELLEQYKKPLVSRVENDPGLFDPRWGPSGEYHSPLTLPNPQNYRERLLVWGNQPKEIIPGDTSLTEAMNAVGYSGEYPATTQSFQTSHFPNQENILAHLRTTDRVTPDGKKVLFIEELQSDWQKQLRTQDKQQADPRGGWNYKVAKLLHDKGLGQYANLTADQIAKMESPDWKYDAPKSQTPDAPLARNYPELVMKRVLRLAADEGYDAVGWTTGKQQAKRYNTTLLQGVSKLDYDITSNNLTIHTPNGRTQSMSVSPSQLPTYIGKEAAEKLVGKLQASPPSTQEEQRPYYYQTPRAINRVIDSILADTRHSDSNYHMAVRLGQLNAARKQAGLEEGYHSWEQLEDDLNTLGKAGYSKYEIRKFKTYLGYKLPPEPIPAPVSLDVSDLQVGERGYSDLYDTSLGKIADKLGKPLGAKTEQREIRVGERKLGETSYYMNDPLGKYEKIHLFPLTPSLKSHAQTKGFPLFQVAPIGVGLGAAAAAKQFEENRKPKSPFGLSY